ncbi:MAG: right-handed parallel beta-helix repeat-containing protein [Deltaproteobacteria bacterium]|nr:right-handed parallel beta-helix repeat-containing protein [Deltaproteobacteria bacterium]MBW2447257.1 right-handed parallel beta-helix repeat-containing protein [Deltaproteobacteria bacterium]
MNKFRTILTGLALAGVLVAPPAEAATTIRVHAGESISAAIEKAEAGATIEVEPGVYHEALTIDTPGITLRGIVKGTQRPVLDGEGKLNDGVIASGSPFTMTGFGVKHYKGNGVSAQGVDGVYLSDLVVDDAGLYGVYPVQSRNITITHCTVTRIVDAGIYVGESNHALVAYNEVHHNVAGIEIENTNDAIVRDNLTYENTAGILVFVLPGKRQKEGKRTRVFRNWSIRNNTPNFGDPHSIVGQLPEGIGIMVMGADDTVVEDNWVKDNQSVGILVNRLAKEHAQKDERLEPFADRNQIRFNYVLENGRKPHALFQEQLGQGGDFAWDGTGDGNCVSLPDQAVHAGAPLPACPEAAPAPTEREESALPTVAPQAAEPAVIPEGSAVVQIRGMRYEPMHLTIAVGQTVTWVNEDGVTHTVTSGDGTMPVPGPLASSFLEKGQIYSHTFDDRGNYEYLCLPHIGQIGMREATITVQ